MKKVKRYKLPKTPCEILYINNKPFTFEIVTKTLGNTINIQLVLNPLAEEN